MDIPARADVCEQCEKIFVGLSGSTKWCPYCGAKHEGESVPFLEVVGYANSKDLEEDGFSHSFIVRSEQPGNNYVDGGTPEPLYRLKTDS